MRHLLVALALLSAGDALAGMRGTGQPFRGGRGSGLRMHVPFSATGGMPDDASTVCHPRFDGTKIVDPYCNWTMSGTVPQNVATPFYPAGFKTSTPGADSFSDANNYTLPTSALNTTGDFSVCVVAQITSVPASGYSVVAARSATNGWFLNPRGGAATPAVAFFSGGVETDLIAGGGAWQPNSINITCFGRAGATGFIKSNLAATTTGSAGAAPAANTGAWLGRNQPAGWAASTTLLYEVYVTRTTPSDALFTSLQLAFYTNPGAPLPEDANVVSHVRWNGTSITDPYNTWTMNGTVSQTTSGFAPPSQRGAGPYSDTARYDLGTGSDPLDLTTFTACFVVLVDSIGTTGVFFDDGVVGVGGGGWGVFFGSTGTASLQTRTAAGGSTNVTTTNLAVTNGPNVVCVGRAGTAQSVKMNLGTTATLSAAMTIDSTRVAHLGRSDALGFAFTSGRIIEAWFSSSAWDETRVTTIMQRVVGMLATNGTPVAVTRASTGTYTTPDGLIWTLPANVARVGCEDGAATKCGMLAEPPATNLLLQSEGIDTASWTKSNAAVTVTANQCSLPMGPSGSLTMERIDNTAAPAGNGMVQSTTIASSVGPFSTSSWIAATTGTATLGIGVGVSGGGTATTCTCARSDGGACTTTTAATNNCIAYATVTTSPVRLMITARFPVAGTGLSTMLIPGTYPGTAVGCYGGAQTEQSAFYATSYFPTTTAAGTRAADVILAANPLASLNPSAWCLEATASPENMRAWSPGATLFPFTLGVGTNGVSNSVRYFSNGGAANFYVHDAVNNKRSIIVADGFAAGSPHRIAFGSSAGALTLRHDGVSVGTPSDVGTGIITTWPANIGIGSDTPGAFNFGGWIRDFKVYRRACR